MILNQIHSFCLINDCTFSLFYERCFFAYICKIRKIERQINNPIEGIERKEPIGFSRADTAELAMLNALRQASEKIAPGSQCA